MAFGNGAPRGFPASGVSPGALCASLNDYEVFFSLAGGCSSDPSFTFQPGTPNLWTSTSKGDWIVPNSEVNAWLLRDATQNYLRVQTQYASSRFYIGDYGVNAMSMYINANRIDVAPNYLYLTPTTTQGIHTTGDGFNFLNAGGRPTKLLKNGGTDNLEVQLGQTNPFRMITYDGSWHEWFKITHSTNKIEFASNTLDQEFHVLGGGGVNLFSDAAAGDTPEFKIYGYRTGDVAQRSAIFKISPDVNDTLRLTNVGTFRLQNTDLTLYQASGTGYFRMKGANETVSFEYTDSTRTLELKYTTTFNFRIRVQNFYIYNPDRAVDVFQFISGSDAFTLGTTSHAYTYDFQSNSSGTFTVRGLPFLNNLKSGATQGGAGAAANEVWKTASHATLPDNVLMIGV